MEYQDYTASQDIEDIDPIWHLHEAFNVFEASALALGYDPQKLANALESYETQHKTDRVDLMSNAIKKAAESEKIMPEEKIRYFDEWTIDWQATKFTFQALADWLQSKGIAKGFFFPHTNKDDPDYLSPRHPRYAPKLAAAVRAWQSVTEHRGKTPKQALEKWLRENATNYGLTKDDGSPNEQGIEDISKVANWNTTGGSPRTP